MAAKRIKYKFILQYWNYVQRGYVFSQVSLLFDLSIKSPSFWVSPYSDYQNFLAETIKNLRSKNMTYKNISHWLNENGYLTPRWGKFLENHVWSISAKKKARDKAIYEQHLNEAVHPFNSTHNSIHISFLKNWIKLYSELSTMVITNLLNRKPHAN